MKFLRTHTQTILIADTKISQAHRQTFLVAHTKLIEDRQTHIHRQTTKSAQKRILIKLIEMR